jgi:phosphoglycolate phosphatase
MTGCLDTFLFDLDGTLLDTHQDMGNALNMTLEAHRETPLPMETIRPFVSRGAMVLICLAFKCQPGSAQATTLWKEFLDHYARNLSNHTCLFDGMEDVLERIESNGNKWGIVTNKPGFLTTPLLHDLGLGERAGSVVSGDTLPQRKPDPAPLLYACSQMGSSPEKSLYVGDDERDIQAGKSAGMATLVAAWGYMVDEDNPADWNADAIIEHPSEIHSWIE